MDKLKENNRIAYLDYLRILAALAIVGIHMTAQNWYFLSYDSPNFYMPLLYNTICVWGVPAFVMISGALFLSRDISIKKLYTKNILRLLCAFLFWGAIYAILAEDHSPRELLFNISYGHYHMWFILMLLGLYMATPILREVAKSEVLTKYYLIVSCLIAIIIPTIIQTGMAFNIPGFISFKTIFDRNLIAMEFPAFVGYSFFYVLGYYIHSKEISKKAETIIYILTVIAFIATITMSIISSYHYEVAATDFLFYKTANVAMMSAGVFVFFKQHLNKTFKFNKVITYVSSCTFGIYLIHLLIAESFSRYLNITTMSVPLVIGIPLFTLVYFLMSLAITAVIRLIPVVKNYLV
ncbi:MAG: acyltransferase family protein [Lachnospiraceae bacterium]|nr:acyltransferase family protein [Lachnospiraceae bacterium]